MWRYLAGGAAALAMGGAAMLALGGGPVAAPLLPEAPPVRAAAAQQAEPAPALPEATPRTREEKRFGRYDKDRNGAVTRDEYMASRRKAYAKLDRDGDGRLSFDEWSVKTTAKFQAADRDKSGAMDAAEFATTAVKRKPARRAAPCPPVPEAEG